MKSLLFVAVPCFSLSAFAAEQAIPSAPKIDRYEAMITRSPFALATISAAPPPPPGPTFASNWWVSGLGRLGEIGFVSIKSKDLSEHFNLLGSDENPTNGVKIDKIEWSEEKGKSVVVIRKGVETARLEFNEADIKAPIQVSNGGVPSMRAGAPGLPPGVTVAGKTGTAQAGFPQMPRMNIPRPNAAAGGFPQNILPGQAPGFPTQPGGAPANGGQPQRRVRYINNPNR